jgi:protein involved in polysaccharide export with SLBB domain
LSNYIDGGEMRRVIIIGFVILFFLTACAPVLKNPSLSNPTLQIPPYLDQEYRVQVGDQLDIKFFYQPELNEQVIVRPDGCISLQLVPKVMAVGLTPEELTEFLTEKYAIELKQPKIAVIVRSYGAQKVYVDGEVAKPGMLPLVGFMTVLQAISQAGGLKETARMNEVIIIRHGLDNQPRAFPVNVRKVIDGTDMHQDIPLKPFDIVYVPRSPIGNVNLWIDQYIRKNIPIYTSFGYNF